MIPNEQSDNQNSNDTKNDTMTTIELPRKDSAVKPRRISFQTNEKPKEIEKVTLEKSEPTFMKMSFSEKLSFIRNNITVEPMLACYITPSVLASLAAQNLSLEKACRVNLRYSAEVCDALSARNTANYTFEETQVQQLVASMAMWKTVLQSALPAFLIMFCGSWSDRHGVRRPCMVLPIVGELLTSLSHLICTYFFYELPMEVAGFAEGFFPAITGGWFVMFMAVFSYIGDITTHETRTLRIGMVNIFCSLGLPFGMALSGILYREIGFYGVFSISSFMYVLAIIYGCLYLPETKKKVEDVKKYKHCNFLRDFFDYSHVVETLKVAFKKGLNNRRRKVIMIMVVVCVVIGPLHGEFVVSYLFMRYRFNWNEVDFSIFSTYQMIVHLIGTMVSVCVFSRLLNIDDAMIGALSCTSKILSGFVYAYATTTWTIYLAPIVEILNGTSFIAMRSMASKLVPADELGKVNSLFGVCESLMPLVYGPMYSAIYRSTIKTMPGAFFLVGGALTFPAVLIFLYMYYDRKKSNNSVKTTKERIRRESVVSGTFGGMANLAYEKDNEPETILEAKEEKSQEA